MKHIFTSIIAFIVCLNGALKAQTTYNTVISSSVTNLRSDLVIAAHANGALDFGHTYSSTVISRLDAMGNLIWAKSYNIDSNPNMLFRAACNNHDSTFIATGITYSNNVGVNGQAFCIKFKANGDTLWCRNLGNSSFIYGTVIPYGIYSTLDSGVVITGYGFNLSQEAFIAKLTKNGNLSWMKVFPSNYFMSIGFSVKQTPDSGYIMCGKMNGTSGTCIYISKFDKSGNLNWFKPYNDAAHGLYTVGYDILVEPTGYLVAASSNSNTLAFLKTDLSGNISWAKNYTGVYTNVYSTPDKCPMSLTKVSSNKHLFVYNANYSSIALMIDSLANFIWAGQSYLTMFDVKPLSNKSFMLIGNQPDIVVRQSSTSELFGPLGVIVTDSLGVNTSTCYYSPIYSPNITTFNTFTVSSLVSTGGVSAAIHPTISILNLNSLQGCLGIPGGIEELKNIFFQIVPNPSSGKISIRLGSTPDKAKFVIQDMTGRILYQTLINSEAEIKDIELGELPSGVYIYSLSEQQIFKTGKLVILK